VTCGAVLVTMAASHALAAEGAVQLKLFVSSVLLQVEGDKDDDWWVQTATNRSSRDCGSRRAEKSADAGQPAPANS